LAHPAGVTRGKERMRSGSKRNLFTILDYSAP